jgi:hypothetical protein
MRRARLAARLVAALGRLRGVTVQGLVGASGTGKSFRARLVAEREGLECIVDDGLVIRRGSILGGQWAKKEETLLAATRRALFDGPGDAEQGRTVLRESRVRGVLIVGTSEEMVRRIALALRLPAPRRWHRIEDIASRAEIEQALRSRGRAGRHALPVPAVDIRQSALRELASRARGLLAPLVRGRLPAAGKPGQPVAAAATPSRGRVLYTEAAFAQMVMHCLQDSEPRARVSRVRVKSRGRWLVVEAGVVVPPGIEGSGRLHELRGALLGCLERHAGLPIRELHLVVEGIAEP